MKRVILFVVAVFAFFYFFQSEESKPAQAPQQSHLTLWDINFVPCLPAKEYATPIVVLNLNGSQVLENISPAAKPFMIHFWAPWCAPCRAELPHFAQFVNQHPDVQIWCVADSEQTPQSIKTFYESQKISGLPVMIDSNQKLSQKLVIDGLPATVFFDAQGREKGRIVGVIHWEKSEVVELILRELLS